MYEADSSRQNTEGLTKTTANLAYSDNIRADYHEKVQILFGVTQ